MKIFSFKSILLMSAVLLTGCGPTTTNLNGDVFLTMQNGSVKPIAGSEIYLFPIETDFDSSFVEPLKTFIASAKYNVAKSEVEALCTEMDNEFPSYLANNEIEIQDYYINDAFVDGLDAVCLSLATEITDVSAQIKMISENTQSQISPLENQITQKQEEIGLIREKLNNIASNEGENLYQEQLAKVRLQSEYSPPSYVSAYTRPDEINIVYTVFNRSDYIVKKVYFSDYEWRGESVIGVSDNSDAKELASYFFEYSFASNSNANYLDIPNRTNSYGETLPGLTKGQWATKSDSLTLYDAWPKSRWLDENVEDIRTMEHKLTESSTCYRACKVWNTFSIDLGFRKIINVDFGHPHTIKTDANNKSRVYITEDVDWVEMGKETDNYKFSRLHDEIKRILLEIEGIKSQIKEIEAESSLTKSEEELSKLQNNEVACGKAQNIRDTRSEITQCLAVIDDQNALMDLLVASRSSFGSEISELFNSITDEDIGYTSFEELLNAFAKSRNAITAVSTIQGSYTFSEIPLGEYVVFTSYSDRFNGVGHWFEEISLQEETKLDLNNINYKKTGVYSYLKDKIDQ